MSAILEAAVAFGPVLVLAGLAVWVWTWDGGRREPGDPGAGDE